jgi:flagellar assembly protein FliH
MPLSSNVLKGVKVLVEKPKVLSLKDTDAFLEPAEKDLDPAIEKQLKWARREAEAILAKAKEEAVGILAKAREQGENLKKLAYEEGKEAGFQAGYDDGLSRGQAEIEELCQQKKTVIKDLQETQQKIYRESEEVLVRLAFTIAEQVIKKQVELDPTTVNEVVKSVLKEAHAGKSYLLFVNPQNLEEVLRIKEELMPFIPPGATLQVLADPEVTCGGCRLETDLGFTDGTIESQLTEIKKGLNLS